ncbi:MAG: deoxyribonuclease IV [Candidatus Babeliales bacterium]|nr:deoxyribonuclease IV [Candidatus Babeliales bacterium]
MNKNKLLLGGHVSISGGLHKAFKEGESIHCTAIQIFTKSNRQWHAKPISSEDAELFKNTLKNSTIKSVIAHASYLINIASLDDDTSVKSRDALKDELERCDQLGIKYLVLHPGTRGVAEQKDSLKRVADNINEIYANNKIQTIVLLEIMAGQGTSVASRFEQLAEIYSHIKFKDKVGICFDTCHAFAAGYDFRTKETYENMWQDFDKILGIDLLKVIHVNDSKKDLGCKVDRHEFLGKGKIGETAFKLLFNDARFINVIKILEVPIETIQDYVPQFKLVLSLLSEKNLEPIKDTPLAILTK